MAFSRITTVFTNPDTTLMNNAWMVVTLPQTITEVSDGAIITSHQWEYPIKNGQAYTDTTYSVVASLPCTQSGLATPGNVALGIQTKDVNGRLVPVGNFVIPAETGGNPVALASLVNVSNLPVIANAIMNISPKGAWNSGTTYAQYETVVYGGSTYVSLQNTNLNKQPDTQTAWWALLIEGVPSSLTGTSAETFAAGMSTSLVGTYLRTLALTGDVTSWATSNRTAGKGVDIKILCDATPRALAFNASWKFIGAKPTALGANKTALLSLRCYGTLESDIVAVCSVEP